MRMWGPRPAPWRELQAALQTYTLVKYTKSFTMWWSRGCSLLNCEELDSVKDREYLVWQIDFQGVIISINKHKETPFPSM